MAKGGQDKISLKAEVYGFNDLKPEKRTVVYKQKEHSPGHALYLYTGNKLVQKVEVTRQSVRGHFLNTQVNSQFVRRIMGLGGGLREEFRQVTSLVLLYENSPFVLQVTSRMNNTTAEDRNLKKLAERLDKELKQVATCQVNIQRNDCLRHKGLAQVYLTENHLCLSNRAVSLSPRDTPIVLATWPWNRVCDTKYYHIRLGQSSPVGLTLYIRMTDECSLKSISFTCQNAEDLYIKFQSLASGGTCEVFPTSSTTLTPTTLPRPSPTDGPPPLIRDRSKRICSLPARYPSRESAELYINWRELNSILHQNPVYHTRSHEYLPVCDGRRNWSDNPLVTYVKPNHDYMSVVSSRTPLGSSIAPYRTLSLSADDLQRYPILPVTLNPFNVPPPPAHRHPQVSKLQSRLMKTTSRGSIILASQKKDDPNVIVQSFLNWRKEQASFMNRDFSGDLRSPQNEAEATPVSEYDDDSIYHPLTNLVMILTCDGRQQIRNRLRLSKRARQNLSLRLNKTSRDDQCASWEDLAHAIGFRDETVDLIKKYVYNRRQDYYEAELVLKFWEYYDNDTSQFDLKPCSWENLVGLLEELDCYDLADRLRHHRQQRQ